MVEIIAWVVATTMFVVVEAVAIIDGQREWIDEKA